MAVKLWTKAQDDFIRDNWGDMPVCKIASIIKRTESAVRQRAYRIVKTTVQKFDEQD
ncbi:MAG: hypothetical protein GOVbin631_55 [Prokaryotic dsDNA virus sp.]|nr:MAG: hypothetical protein GOVbin631_55 [Prokaryotic dsDNA virus sp.]